MAPITPQEWRAEQDANIERHARIGCALTPVERGRLIVIQEGLQKKFERDGLSRRDRERLDVIKRFWQRDNEQFAAFVGIPGAKRPEG